MSEAAAYLQVCRCCKRDNKASASNIPASTETVRLPDTPERFVLRQ